MGMLVIQKERDEGDIKEIVVMKVADIGKATRIATVTDDLFIATFFDDEETITIDVVTAQICAVRGGAVVAIGDGG